MPTIVKLSRTATAYGRNKTVKTTALYLWSLWGNGDTTGDCVAIDVETTRGPSSGVNIHVPLEDIDALCAALQTYKRSA